MTTAPIRNQKLDLRLTPQAKAYLQAAAQTAHRSVSEFVLESALSKAEETLAERRAFALDAERWEAFSAALDAEPRDLPAVRELFNSDSPFESR
ncbi:DUF1778 domain-containing protein [Asticcacaulis sp. BYS171W]|uniref:DUF1778 domain-containing protein n=1 Tax=Asticcacaulis aquaticus TaxID=2984212 RepID=A0ABT5HSK0_9CAUL|nr:DUF1778 domain-containing protein [Asticcacaulis aquaticus]MDC7682928.1 DUF1778 domain-containing protein [Asticcacaulis aquaticus]